MIFRKMHVQGGDNLPYRGMKATRNAMVELFKDLGYKVGAEIGIRKGEYSKIMCDIIPDLKLYCVDPWTPYPMVTSEEKQALYYQITLDTLRPYGDRAVIMKETSVDAAKKIPDSSLDFVYIDGAHDFDNVIIDLITWNEKVRSGGIISGHDYYHSYKAGIVFAVDAYTRAHNINPWYITRDSEPTWFWVRP